VTAVSSAPRSGGKRRKRPADGRMALADHLREFRNRLGISLLALAVGVVVAFIYWQPIYDFLSQPYCRTQQGAKNCNLYAFGIFDQFLVRMKVSFIAGSVLTAPIWLYQLGAFITPALHRKEKKYAAAFLGASLVLFSVGCVFAYLTVSRGLDFLLRVGGGDVLTLLSIQSYLSFVTLMLVAFGVAFLFPVVITFLNLTGILSTARMRSSRRGMIFGIFAMSALITPSQDPFTFMVMAIPLCILYEGCIIIGRVRDRTRRKALAADPVAQLADDETSYVDPNPSYVDPRPSSL
jgi:sec-independent protein translocase protein TatC